MPDDKFLKVALNVPLAREFDYLADDRRDLPAIGCRVRVRFGNRTMVGLVSGHAAESAIPRDKLKPVIDRVDEQPLFNADDLWLLRFTARYYHHPLGEVVHAALPAHLRRGERLDARQEILLPTAAVDAADLDALARRAPRQSELLNVLIDAGADGVPAGELNEVFDGWRPFAKALADKGLLQFEQRASPAFDESSLDKPLTGPKLTDAQTAAVDALRTTDRFASFLIDGVTGSGKTEVYLQRIREVIDNDQQVLVLVPEIGLTPQLMRRFRERLGIEPALLHSGLGDTARLAAWRAAHSGAARLIVGTRSAVFVPLPRPGLIVVDEEHDASLKQQEGLRYSARDLAVARAKRLDIPVLLGSATPTLESLQQARLGNYRRLVLPVRPGGTPQPTLRLIDTIRQPASDGLSEPVVAAMRRHLADDGQVLVFLNRRGFAPTLICSACAHVAGCARCDSRLTVHAARGELRCHHCGVVRPLMNECEECGQPVQPLGEGTQRLEEALGKRFPEVSLRRIDSDSTRRPGAMLDALDSATRGEAQILVGTQMLSKGHHFPKLTLVGIVNADQGLFSTDFRSAERMAQSIVQVAGRAGREQQRGEVLIQTAFAGNPFWKTLLDGGYAAVAEAALSERRQANWPPFSRLALLRASAHQRRDAFWLLQHAAAILANPDGLRVLGPVDAPMARRAGRYRCQLLLQGENRAALHRSLAQLRPALENEPRARRARWSIDVDPVELF